MGGVERGVPRRRPVSGGLTEPELMTLRYASRGLTEPETADALGRSLEAVNDRLERCRLKLNARTTTQAVAEAIRRGLIP
jgi:DNA-binding CsgD family transcriptional regulator